MLCVIDDGEYELPKEIWKLILSLPVRQTRWRLCAVSSLWSLMVCESVLSVSMLESAHLNNSALKRLTFLHELALTQNSPIDDEGISGLVSLASLTWDEPGRNIQSFCKVTNDGIKGLTNLRYLSLFANKIITDDGIANLSGSLQTLHLRSSWRNLITDDGLAMLTNLQSLFLPKTSGISDAGVSGLSNLTLLELSLSACAITNAGILGLTNLTRLGLHAYQHITDDGLEALDETQTIESEAEHDDLRRCCKGLDESDFSRPLIERCSH